MHNAALLNVCVCRQWSFECNIIHVHLQRYRLVFWNGTAAERIYVQKTPQTSIRVLEASRPV